MNIETVNELIQSLESAGELSIKELKYLELAREFKQLAAESVGLKKFIQTECFVGHLEPETFYEEEVTRYVSADGYEPASPATDRIVAGIKAEAPLYRHVQPAPAVVGETVAKKVACWSCQNEVEISAIGDCDGYCPNCNSPIHLDEEPYTAPQSAPDRDQVRREHAEWSQATFGNVGPIGPLKHLSKEALEAAAEPCDLSEWADMQFLLWDAQRRAGITDDQITQAMIEKLAVNKQREWPEPKDGEPRLHIKEQPAPVVPEEKPMPNPLSMYAVDAVAAIAEAKGWNACRAAMLQHQPQNAQQNIPENIPGGLVEAVNNLLNNDGSRGCYDAMECGTAREKIELWLAQRQRWEEQRKANLSAGNSPVIPDGYVMVPKEPTQAMCAAFNDSDYGRKSLSERYVAMLAVAPQEVSHD